MKELKCWQGKILILIVYRNVYKYTDGDLAKISLDMSKPKDYAYKWRWNKNVARFFKNPLGYTAWRYIYMQNQNRGPTLWTITVLTICCVNTYLLSKKSKYYRKTMREWQIDRGIQLWSLNKNDYIDDRLVTGPDTTTFKKHISNFNAMFKNPHGRCATTAYWCRDQNFRKYFEIRKRHGIEPSTNESTYYNKDKEQLYWNSQMKAEAMLSAVNEIK